MINKDHKIHKLYNTAFRALRAKAKMLGISIRNLAKIENYSGKVLRRGTPGALGVDLRPRKSAKTDRRGCKVPGNSRNRRFARRHPQHFTPVVS